MKNQQTPESILERLTEFEIRQKNEELEVHEEVRRFMSDLRNQMGETAEQFATRSGGVKRHYIYMIESGSRRWSNSMLASFIHSLNQQS
jgi:hypothetical protein